MTEAFNYEILFQSKPFSLPMMVDFENKYLLMEVDLQYCIPKLRSIDVYFYTNSWWPNFTDCEFCGVACNK